MSEIKHIVYLMLENRSMDQVLGWLYDKDFLTLKNNPCKSLPDFDGLKEGYFNLDKVGCKHYVQKGTGNNMNVPIHDPHEGYLHVNNQVFGSEMNPVCPQPPTMGGFYQDFASFNDRNDQIMQSYTPQELPVLNGLARNFAVSDRYFSSVPTQTNCNRAFAACGNSLGLDKDGYLTAWVNNRNFDFIPPHISQPLGRQFNQKTMWNVLSDNGMDQSSDWMHYNSCGDWIVDHLGLEGYSYTRDLMEQLRPKCFDHHFDKMSSFFKKAKTGNLPTVCFLEPEWGLEFTFHDHDIGINGTDYHPPSNLAPGEAFVKQIYDALTYNKEAWSKTLWIVNFDEHGGTYDHVPPPWNATPPWASDGTPPPVLRECCFEFDRFGVRVPLILVSPLINPCTVFRASGETPYDHTSVIATILNLVGIPKEKWGLGGRTANAPTFENVWKNNLVRTDLPIIETNPDGLTCAEEEIASPPNDIQMRMAGSLLSMYAQKRGIAVEKIEGFVLKSLTDSSSMTEFSTILKTSFDKLKTL